MNILKIKNEYIKNKKINILKIKSEYIKNKK